ncbi:response regulator [Hyalangium rubrum]|uniref:Response regulator n=1 Tax=Hyalangium rubrum TaxID=3103134 RepID=A0ABU5GYE6_9BACT|nr:response regulator [Hyalangium sp. s54d21]MDY7226066.1 response regulator [Hyalangium sp. s54d21]
MSAARILVVDDEESLRITLAANLELEGHEVVEASTGEEALRLVRERPVDVVLADIRMPGLHGVELNRHLRREQPGLPVVLMTAFAQESLVGDALAEGVFTVLPKPFDVEHLLSTLRRAARTPEVLVVDDSQEVAEATVEGLRLCGVRAEAVFDGDAAVERVRSGVCDVCVVDLVMPGMTGPEMVGQLRHAGLPVAIIAVSGHDVPEMMRQVAALGDVACMRKPISIRELAQTIARTRAKPLVKS